MKHSLWQHTLCHSAGSRHLELWHRLLLQAIRRSTCTHLGVKWMRGVRWVSFCKLRWKEELVTQLPQSDNRGEWSLPSDEEELAFPAVSGFWFSVTRPQRTHPVPHFRDEVSERDWIWHIFPEKLLCARQHMRLITGIEWGIKYSPCPLRGTVHLHSDLRINQAVGSTITERQDTVKRSSRKGKVISVQGIWGIL